MTKFEKIFYHPKTYFSEILNFYDSIFNYYIDIKEKILDLEISDNKRKDYLEDLALFSEQLVNVFDYINECLYDTDCEYNKAMTNKMVKLSNELFDLIEDVYEFSDTYLEELESKKRR